MARLALLAGLSGDVGTAAAQSEWRTDFSRHTVPLEELVPGGPPKDGIPALDRPRFVSVPAAFVRRTVAAVEATAGAIGLEEAHVRTYADALVTSFGRAASAA